MDWLFNLLLLLGLMSFVYTWSPIPSTNNNHNNNNVPSNNFIRSRSFSNTQTQAQQQHYYQRNAVSPYLDLMFCPLREQPWSCARQQSARLLDIWDGELNAQWQKLKVEADRQLNSTLQRRGYSDSTTLSKEKPSTILKKIEIGTKYMKDYLAETMDGFLGREYEYLQNTKNHYQSQNDAYNEEEYDEEEEEEAVQNDNDNNEQTGDVKNSNNADEHSNSNNVGNLNNSEPEFIEIEEEEHEDEEHNEENEENNEENTNDGDGIEEGKKPGGDKRKKKKKKGSSHDLATHAANLLVIKPVEHQLASHHDDSFGLHGATQLLKPVNYKIKPAKQKKKKKKGGHGGGHGGHGGGAAEIYVEQEPATDHFGLGLLEELAEWDDDTGGKRKKKHPMKYGRSNGVTRGKKKKKKKAIMKLMLLASFIKAKIELLLKLLGAHLQIKFFAIALIGLLINIARFWIDVKRGGTPQKVVYVEHAHHQHHYEDHGDDWSESAGGGGYWKRSLQTDSTENTYDSATDSYQPKTQQYQPSGQQYDAQYMAYKNQWQRK